MRNALKNHRLVRILWFPFFLLLIHMLTWAIQIGRYGFYLDDWIYLSAYDQGGFEGLLQYSINDSRPGLLAWVIGLGFKLFGNDRLWWQLWSLFWRYQAGIAAWLLIRSLWPGKRIIAEFTAILLMIFPFFKHQAFSIAYNLQWIQSAMILYSFWLTVKAIRSDNRKKKLFRGVALLLSGLQLFMTEYYLSLELLRIPLIWLALEGTFSTTQKKVRRVFREYLPYGLILTAFILMRFAIMPGIVEDRNTLSWMGEYSGVWNLLLHLVQLFIGYLSESVFGVWYRSLDPAAIDFSRINDRGALALAILVFMILLLAFWRKRTYDPATSASDENNSMLALGIMAMLLGFLPGMAIDKSPSTAFVYHDRFLLPSFFGIALSLVSFVDGWIRGGRLKLILLSLFCMISVFFQVKNSIYYRSAWENQQNFQWQLKWRVPDLKENTLIAGDGIIASFMGGWADGAMVLEMYGKEAGVNPTPYWYLVFGEGDYQENLDQQIPITYVNKIFDFKSEHGNMLVVTKPEWDRCLWVLDELDLANPYIQEHTKQLIRYQNESRILYASDHQMPTGVFGADYRHDWCYFFENGDREFALGNYKMVIDLYQQAQIQNERMKNPVEMTPFIRAAAALGDWQLAAEMTMEASYDPKISWEYFKGVWDKILADTPESPERTQAVESIRSLISAPQ